MKCDSAAGDGPMRCDLAPGHGGEHHGTTCGSAYTWRDGYVPAPLEERKDEKRTRVERTGPSVSLGDFVVGRDPVPAGRKHAQGCTVYFPGGACVDGCETDAELRARLQERYG